MIFILAASIPAGIVYASSLDTMMPSDSNTDALYNRYGVSQYSFQTVSEDHHFWQVGAAAKDSIVGAYDSFLSAAFLAIVQLTRFFNFVARQAFSFSLMNDLIDGVAEIIKQVTGVNAGIITSGGLVDSLGGMAVMITALYIVWLMVKMRFLDGMQQAFSFIIALVVMLGFFSNAGMFLKSANNLTTYFGSAVFSPLAKATGLSTNSTDGIVIISEEVWSQLVIRPYTMLQFDSGDLATKDPALLDQVLKTQPFSEEREAVLSSAATKYPAVAQARSSEQIILIIVFLIFSIIILGFLTYWSIVTIFMRFKLLIRGSSMSITLLASLLPGREAGIAVVRSQFLALLGTSMTTFMTIFLMDLSLVMGHITYSVSYKSSGNWFLSLFLEALMVYSIFKYRDEITNVFQKATGIPARIPKAKNTFVDALQRNVTRSLYNTAAGKVGGLFKRTEREGVPASFSPSAISRASTNLNDATTSSMALRYQREKEASESLAADEGKNVQYTPYVQRVNENLCNGAKNPFRGMDKEWNDEKQRLKHVQDDHGDMKQAILSQGVHEGMTDQEAAAMVYSNEHAIRKASTYMVERPKRVGEQMARVKTLNRNNQLKTSIDDFCMIQLFERYKVDYKKAVDASNVTGGPVKHSDFVKNMDAHFAEAGLSNTMKMNNTMLHRNSRIAIAPVFEEMPEFQQMKMKLLHANEALRRIAPPTPGLSDPLPIHFTAPIDTEHAITKMPKLPAADIVSQMQERREAIRNAIEPASGSPKVIPLPDSYLRKPKAQLAKSVIQTAPVAKVQALPYSTEYMQRSIPKLPDSGISEQMLLERQGLRNQINQSLSTAPLEPAKMAAPGLVLTGPAHPQVIQKQFPAVSASGIRQQLQDQKNSKVRQALVAYEGINNDARIMLNGSQVQVEQGDTEHSFAERKNRIKPSVARSTIEQETSVRSRFKVLGSQPKDLDPPKESLTSSSYIKNASYTLNRMYTAKKSGEERMFANDEKGAIPARITRKIVQKDTELRSRFKVIPPAVQSLEPSFGNHVPDKQAKTVQFTLHKDFKNTQNGRHQVEEMKPIVKTQKVRVTQDTELKKLEPGALNAKLLTNWEQRTQNDVRVTARRRTNMPKFNVPDITGDVSSSKQIISKTVSQDQLKHFRINRNEQTQVDLNRVKIKNPELKMLLDARDIAFPELSSAPKVASSQKLQQDSLHQIRINHNQATHLEHETGRKTSTGSSASSIPAVQKPNLRSSTQRTEQAVLHDQKHRVNVTKQKQVQVDTRTVQFKDSGIKTSIDQGQAALESVRSTNSVSVSNISASKLYRVNVNRENGLKVKITGQDAPPKMDSLFKNRKDSAGQTVKETVTRDVNLERKMITNLGVKSVHFKNAELKFKIEQATTKIHQNVNDVSSMQEIKPALNLNNAIKVQKKVSPLLSEGLDDELRHLKTMERVRKVAPVSAAAESVSKLIQSKAKTARQNSTNHGSGERG